MFLHFCTVGLGSTISALQVGMVENVKFNDDLATFFATFFAKSYTVTWEYFLTFSSETKIMKIIHSAADILGLHLKNEAIKEEF